MRHFLFSTFVISSLVAAPLLTSAAPSYTTSTFLSSIDSGNGLDSEDAYIDEPKGFDLGDDSSIFLVDTVNNSVEKIADDGTLTTIAGTHQYGFVNGANSSAQFAGPEDIAVYGDGEQIFVADTGNNVIRKIEGGNVTTFLSGLSGPKGLALDGDTLFVSDTGNNRILAINRNGGTATTFVSGLDQPTKLLFWQKARSIIFVNFGAMTVQAKNVDTGKLSEPLISDLEDIGGIFLKGRTLYVAASYDIGVFNQLWKVRLEKPDPSGNVETVSVKLLSEHRERESLNWPSDILVREDTVKWEEYYTWEQNLLFSDAAAESLQCLPIKKAGEDVWRKKWFMRVKKGTAVQSQDFILKSGYQGDQPFFRVKLQYDNKDFTPEHRERAREKNQSPFTKGPVIASVEEAVTTAPTGLKLLVREPKHVTLAWTAVEGATKYKVQLWHKDQRILTKSNVQKRKVAIKPMYLTSNYSYKFRVKTCTDGVCGDWSEFKKFRTPPAAPEQVLRILPNRGERITQLPNGKFKATLTFKLHKKKNKNLRAKVQLCSKHTDHPDEVTVDRVYVLYKGGSAILVFRKNGSRPQHYAGKHRFQDEYGAQVDALLGRPKAIAFSSDGVKMYIAENNKLAVYDMYQKTLTELAGHLMDSYTEGVGSEARFSDITSIAISPDDDWLYVVDRNNHRIRKVNTATGETEYITGAGGTNFSFGSEESNGYQEGGPCPDETERGVAGCAYFNRPTGIAISPDGEALYVAEGSNNRVRKVDIDTGVTSLVAGSGTAGFTNGTGSAATFNGPYSLDITSDGDTLYVADKSNHAIRKIDLNTNTVTTVVGRGVIGKKDGAFSGAYLAIPEYVQEENGVLYWTEAGTHTVRAAFLSSQQVVTLSGNSSRGYTDGAGVDAEWNNPKGFDFRAGKMYVADSTNDVIRTIQF